MKNKTKEILISKVLPVLAFLFGMAFMVSISAGYIAWALLLIFLIGDMVVQKRLPGKEDFPFLGLFVLYVLWGLFSSFMGAGFERSFYYWRSDLLCILCWSLYILFRWYPESRQYALRGFWIAAFFLAIAGLMQYFMIRFLPHWNDYLAASDVSLLRKFAVMQHHQFRVHANLHILTYAEIMVLAGLFALGQTWKIRWLKPAVVSLCFAGMLASVSRGAFLSYMVGAAIFFAVSFSWRRKIAWSMIAPVVLMGVLLLSSPFVWGRIMDTFQLNKNRDRLVMWRVGSHMIRDYPLTGVGIGHVKTFWTRYCEQDWKQYLHDNREVWSDVHSLYFQQASERGLPGLFFVVLLLVAFPLEIWRRMKSKYLAGEANLKQRESCLAAFAALVAFLVMNITESAFQDTEVVFTLYFILAITLASSMPALAHNGHVKEKQTK